MTGIVDKSGTTSVATVDVMTRTFDLAKWAGRWVAVDESGTVQRQAETMAELLACLDADRVEGVEIMRAPVPGEPVYFGVG
jgi:hypothetical protein